MASWVTIWIPDAEVFSFLSMMWQPFVMKDLYEQVFGSTVDEHFMARLADHNCRLMENGLRGTLKRSFASLAVKKGHSALFS